jgi:signal transduction histidine kinase
MYEPLKRSLSVLSRLRSGPHSGSPGTPDGPAGDRAGSHDPPPPGRALVNQRHRPAGRAWFSLPNRALAPRTATGQLIAVATLALIVSQIVIVTLTIGEQQSAIREWWTTYILGRVASVTELLDATAEDAHQKVLFASDTPVLTFDISTTQPTPDHSPDSEIYTTELRGLINKPPEQVFAEVRNPPSYTDVLQYWLTLWRKETPADTEPWLEAWVQLANGKWLSLEVERRLEPPSLALLLIPAITTLLVFGTALVIVIRAITRPIKSLARAAEAFGRGEEVGPVELGGPAEIREATAAFNNMRERLSRFVLDRTRMLASVGHDLRTPITTMRLRAEFIEDDEIRERILASLEEMQHMAEAALAFAREEATSEPTRMVDLTALVQTVCADQADMNRPVTFHENGRLLYPCRANSLKRAVRNLVENAIVHGKSADVSLRGTGAEVSITVDDHGPGIPETDMARVFMPFVRLDEARGEETGGIGLGLAIARSIVRGHGGDIRIGNRREGGLRATIQLPLKV